MVIQDHPSSRRWTHRHWDQEELQCFVLTRGQDNCLYPHPLILDFTLTHDHYGSSNVYPTGKITHTLPSNGVPHPDGTLKKSSRSDFPLPVDSSGRLYDDFLRLIFFHTHHWESSDLARELPEESDQFQFIHTVCLVHLRGSVGLILGKDSTEDLYSPGPIYTTLHTSPHFIRSRRFPPFLPHP